MYGKALDVVTANEEKKTIGNKDPLLTEAAKLIVNRKDASTALIQRKLAIGYNRAGRIMDQLEILGIVGPANGSKARKLLKSYLYTCLNHLPILQPPLWL